MRYGFVIPGGAAPEQLELAVAADQAGWDGVFVWEAAYGVDAWTLLAAMAQRTARVRLGTMLTPVPWRRPWKLAGQVVTLDNLSGGRAILAAGLGAVDPVLGTTGEVTGRRERAERLDEALDLITGLWEGRLVYSGRHYEVDLSARADELALTARPAGDRIPVWVVGAWFRERSMRRVTRFDGLLPNVDDGQGGWRPAEADEVPAMAEWLRANGAGPGFDIVVEGETPAGDRGAAGAAVAPFAEAGATWWLEAKWSATDPATRFAEVRRRVEAGPPRP